MTALLVAMAPVLVLLPAAAARPDLGRVELLRDHWGIPHVFAETDAGAFYGLGWAAAEDRGFQMTLSLRIVQGRLAEVIGDAPKIRGRESAAEHDLKMRTFSFHRAARELMPRLDPESVALLEAYSRGVNDYFSRHPDDLHPLWGRLGLMPEPWTPADCIASWWRLGQFFGTDGTRDLIAYRNLAERQSRPPPAAPLPDDAAAVVRREDVSEAWLEEVLEFARRHGVRPAGSEPPRARRFSHAWAVGRRRLSTGSAVLVSDPQTAVANPSLVYEFHFRGRTFDARGVGVAGSPVVLIGWNERVAWGMTALGADQADLFRLKTDPERPGEYFFDGEWRRMESAREEIRVRGGKTRHEVVRWMHLGPVVTRFAFPAPGDPEVALKRIPVCEKDRETFQGSLAMLRARDAREFLAALAGWRFPSANVVFADAGGNIGYSVAGALPVRSPGARDGGQTAGDGTASRCDWQGTIPARLLPHVINPRSGVVLSANHRPVASFYPLSLGAMTGSGGDTIRSWRLRERLEAKETFTPREVLEIHHDAVNPARRAMVRLGLHLRATGVPLSREAAAALEHLEPWYRSGAVMDLGTAGAPLAMEIPAVFRRGATSLAAVYGGGQAGLCAFLRHAVARVAADPPQELTTAESEYVDRCLAEAWRRARERLGDDPAQWSERARASVAARTLGYGASLDGFGSLDPTLDVRVPALSTIDGDTIRSQAAQAYTQWVPLHDVDGALSILPIGQSDRPGSPSRLSTYAEWEKGVLHPAPLSRPEVEKHVVSRRVLAP